MKPPFDCFDTFCNGIKEFVRDYEKGRKPEHIFPAMLRFIDEMKLRKEEHEAMTDEEWNMRQHLSQYFDKYHCD